MKKNKFELPKPKCDKCGKEATIDEKMSNKNWTVYKDKEPCECGGEFKFKGERYIHGVSLPTINANYMHYRGRRLEYHPIVSVTSDTTEIVHNAIMNIRNK